jgi:hypothetical protein
MSSALFERVLKRSLTFLLVNFYISILASVEVGWYCSLGRSGVTMDASTCRLVTGVDTVHCPVMQRQKMKEPETQHDLGLAHYFF